MKRFTLSNGGALPALGLGTWQSERGEVGAAVREAVRLGYRHIDCAKIYLNEAEIGEALSSCVADGLVTREELWITSKLWNDRHARDDVLPALKQTLNDLRLDDLDLYLVHWPVAQRKGVLRPETGSDLLGPDVAPLAETWAGMEACVDAGLCRHIGVSNFSAPKLAALIEGARIEPEVLQVELHPYLQQPELVSWAQEHGVVVTSYCPLGSRDRPPGLKEDTEPILLEDPVIGEIAQQRGVTPAQVLIAWGLHRGTSVIPKSVDPAHLRENLEAAEIALTDDDALRIADLDRHRRYITGKFWEMEGSPYTLANLWDT